MDVSRAGNSVKNWQNFPISNPKPDLHNINAHIKFGENPLIFTQVVIWKWKYQPVVGSSVKIWQNLPISNLKPDLHNINALTKFGENPLTLILLKLSSGNENTDGQMYDRQMDGHTDSQSETIIPRLLHGGGV